MKQYIEKLMRGFVCFIDPTVDDKTPMREVQKLFWVLLNVLLIGAGLIYFLGICMECPVMTGKWRDGGNI